ncbi:shikimate dehydrogenase [Rhodophyticola porphyridii]|uniref:Shikimate dehydrogenase (NADP(+)) n=1 Tax=Rhodophyticola porphyridii TaxID=1852017 RepID=A0A3L9Y9S1_9RHOB|nr:shikimate dehydrogenase [Rhodophyticola porphyridii]RMA42806.1 shikimate dehydrogenase [Rhodophyticola porphyridii]
MSVEVPLAGVIGNPVSHSRSPALHGHWLHRYGINGHYVPLKVTHEDLKKVIRALPKMGFLGVNITIPHKEQVLSLADSVSDRAALIGAANTITFSSKGKVQADNTDGMGFLANLHQNAPDWRADAGPALVLGAGGAARAIVSALLSEGAPEVFVVNRTRARGEALRDKLGARVKVVDWTRIPELLPDQACLVNTTSLGMEGGQPLNINLSTLRPSTLVTDVVYTPLQTSLLQQAAAIGCPIVDGLGMLLHQATPGFERWFGQKPEVDDALRQAVLSA